MTNHLTRTKEAYLEMMNNLLKERQDITKMYYEVKAKVDEIDKLLMAGDSGKVGTGQAAEIMAYAELFNKRHEEPKKEAPAPREKLKVNIPIETISNEEIDKLRAVTKSFTGEALEKAAARMKLTASQELKDLPKPRQATAAELIASSVEPVKEDKHILPVEPQKAEKPKRRRGKLSVHSQQGVEEMVKILQKYAREQAIQVKEFYERFNEEVVEVDFASFQAALSKAKRKDSRIGKAGYGYYIYQIL